MRVPAWPSLLTAATFVTLVAAATPAHADWPMTGAPITRVQADIQHPFLMASDGAGGAYFAWASITGIASRLTVSGEPAPGWGDGGLRFGGPTSRNVLNVADGAGGCYFLFNAKDCVAHCGVDPAQRRVLRLGPDGSRSPSWPEGGIAVAELWGPVGVGASDAGDTRAIPDGDGGLVIGWGQHVDGRSGPVELRLQRMDSLGTRLWGRSGLRIRQASLAFPRVALASAGRGAAIAAWVDERLPHLFAQRVSPAGQSEWDAEGVALAADSVGFDSPPLAVSDGAGGAIIAWCGAVGSDRGIFAVRVDGRGRLPWRRPVCVARAAAGLDGLQLLGSVGGDAILVWRDPRVAGRETVHVQRIGNRGRLEWGRGVVVSDAPSHKDYVAAATDAFGGAYIAWGDTRPEGEVYASHLDGCGGLVRGWDRDGTPICPPVAALWQVSLVAVGRGDALLAWSDERLPTSGLPFRVTQAARLLPFGPHTRVGGAPARSSVARASELPTSTQETSRFALHGASPNPGRMGVQVRLSLPDATPTTLAPYDIAGRKLWSRDVGALGAGEHSVPIANGAWLPPGTYFARLTSGAASAHTNIVIRR